MLLTVKELSLEFPETAFQALDKVSFSIAEGEILALVGESGSGKTLTASCVLGLEPANALTSGEILYKDENLRKVKDLRQLRGKNISLIPQDPLSSLNPMYSIHNQLHEALRVHNAEISDDEIFEKCKSYLEKVGIPDPERVLQSYPHEISGGMRQRVMIAMAILNEPDLLIADEPTTALDVTVQAVILKLLKSLGKTILFITHDLGVVAEIADRVLVMRQGKIVEEGTVFDIFDKAQEDYTKELLSAVPKI